MTNSSHSSSKLFGNHSLETFDINSILEYKRVRTKQVSPVTFNIELRTMRGIFNRAVMCRHITANPCTGVREVVIDEPPILSLTPEEVSALFDAISDNFLFRTICLHSLHTFCRRNEVLYTKIKNINLDSRYIIVVKNESFRTKTRKTRTVPVSDELLEVLSKHINGNDNIVNLREPDSYLYLNEKGLPFHEDTISKWFRYYRDKAGLPKKYHFHCLRHTGISNALNVLNIPVSIVQRIAGHNRITTTQKYLHVRFEQMLQAAGSFKYIK